MPSWFQVQIFPSLSLLTGLGWSTHDAPLSFYTHNGRLRNFCRHIAADPGPNKTNNILPCPGRSLCLDSQKRPSSGVMCWKKYCCWHKAAKHRKRVSMSKTVNRIG